MSDWKEEVKERYRIFYDKETGAFHICDLWHESVKNLPLDAVIPEDSPAIKILSSLEINALLGELDKLGWLSQYKKFSGDLSIRELPQRKTLQEIVVDKIAEIVLDSGKKNGANDTVVKEAISTLREIIVRQ